MTFKRTRKPSSGPITLLFDGDDLPVRLMAQKEWLYELAAGIERGALPAESNGREMIAAILRQAADQAHLPDAKVRGNPQFERMLPSDDTIPLLVAIRIGKGDDAPKAIAHVATSWHVDDSTVRKLFQPRRAALADHFAHTNLAHRCGAIRGK